MQKAGLYHFLILFTDCLLQPRVMTLAGRVPQSITTEPEQIVWQ